MSKPLSTPADVRVLHEGEFLRLLRREHWEYVVRPRSSGACFVVAVTPQNELVLVEQYRWPLRCNTLELPAGIIGDSDAFADENAEASALRELEEETGFRGQRAKLLFTAPTAAGLTAETSYFVRVEQLERVHEGGGVDDENITVHCVALNQVHEWLDSKRSAALQIDARIYAALHWLSREASKS
jgi:ADP-ribose pyrophosphatase